MNPLALLALTLQGAQSPTPVVLSLDDALKIADRSAYAILLAQSNVELQHQKVLENAGKLGPSITVNGTYTRFDQASKASFGGNTFTVQPIDTKTASAVVGYVVDITGNTRRILRSSEAGLLAQKETLEATRDDTRQTVKTAYYAILRAEAQVKVAQEAVDSDSERVHNTQLQLQQGVVAKIDLLRAQAQLGQSKSDLITAQNALDLAKQSLNYDLARPIETPVEVVDVGDAPSIPLDGQKLTESAELQRPEVKALEQTVKSLKLIRQATEQGNLPSLNLQVTMTQNIGALGFGARQQTATGVAALSWPIFDSGQTRARVKEARQSEAQAEIQLQQTQLSVSQEVRQALTNFANAKARLSNAHDQVAAAREALRLAELKQAQGEGIFLDVLDARSSLTQAEQGEVNAKYDLWQSVADLQRAYGSDQLPTNSQ